MTEAWDAMRIAAFVGSHAAADKGKWMLPTFLGIGSQRCGTTWLGDALRMHPQVHLSRPKELNYFAHGMLRHDLAWYRHHFRLASGGEPRTHRGEISPMYSRLSTPAVERVRQMLPEARIIYVIRHPIERAWSQILLELAAQRQLDVHRLTRLRILQHLERLRSVRYGNYARALRIWCGVYGDEPVHVDYYERLKADGPAMYRDVLRHIGADPTFELPGDTLSRRVNASATRMRQATPPIPDEIRWYLAAQLAEPTRELAERIGGLAATWADELATRAREARPSWRMRRLVVRMLLRVPERAAYAGYLAMQEHRMRQRFAYLMKQECSYSQVTPETASPDTATR